MKKIWIAKLSALAAVITLVGMISINASASNDSDKRPGPPPEAFAACKGKAVGDAVTVSGRNGEKLEAVCKEIQDQLVAVPDRMPPK